MYCVLGPRLLQEATNHENDLPPFTIRREEDGDEPSELEIRARWQVHEWEDLPEFNLMRSITVLSMAALAPDPAQNIIKHQAWFTSHTIPLFAFKQMQGDNRASFTLTLFGKPYLTQSLSRVQDHTTKLSAPERFVKGVFRSDVLIEDDVLYSKQVHDFKGSLTWQGSEQLVTYLTAPYVRMPLVAAFLNEDRLGALFQPKMRLLLERVLFEPLAHYPDIRARNAQVQLIQVVPTPKREQLGTQFGMLFNEMQHAPEATVEPLLRTAHKVASMCINDYTSSFVDLLLYMIYIIVRVEGFIVFLANDDTYVAGRAVVPTAPVAHTHPSPTAQV